MILFNSVVKNRIKCRSVGMADEADSKSVAGNRVWVQVPFAALINKKLCIFDAEFFLH